eukprot:TRINITY_DN513_c11_g1_i1.p1 TRINITY_DN513_c11_g1~~TRINITY_DN513_c11_g1_i1.p1  ORF type:complete len:304 (+),score=59.33 TRINITY_DN513_c11_g1_i1:70-912(+)
MRAVLLSAAAALFASPVESTYIVKEIVVDDMRWCSNNDECTVNGDTGAQCSSNGRCTCTTPSLFAATTYGGETAYTCHLPNALVNTHEISLVIKFPEASCSNYAYNHETWNDWMAQYIRKHLGTTTPEATAVRWNCPYYTTVVTAPFATVVDKLSGLGAYITRYELPENPALADILGSEINIEATGTSMECAIDNAEKAIHVGDGCIIVSCKRGYFPSWSLNHRPWCEPNVLFHESDDDLADSDYIGIVVGTVFGTLFICIFVVAGIIPCMQQKSEDKKA